MWWMKGEMGINGIDNTYGYREWVFTRALWELAMHVGVMKMNGWGKNDTRRWVKQAWGVLGVAVCMGLHARERDDGNEWVVFLMGGEGERVTRKRCGEWRVRKRSGYGKRRERKRDGLHEGRVWVV